MILHKMTIKEIYCQFDCLLNQKYNLNLTTFNGIDEKLFYNLSNTMCMFLYLYVEYKNGFI